MAYVSPSTQPTGTLVTSTMYAQLVNDLKFFHGPPTASAKRAATLNIPSGVWTSVTFDTSLWTSDAVFNTSTGKRIVIKTAGKYLITFRAAFALASTAGPTRGIGILKNATGTTPTNGSAIIAGFYKSAARPGFSITDVAQLAVNDFISGAMFQDSGSNLATSTVSDGFPTLTVMWMSS